MERSRDELVGQAERLIRRGELGEAAALLEEWTRAHPDDAQVLSRLKAVRALADPAVATRGEPAPAARPAPVRAADDEASAPLPDDPVSCLGELLARIQVNRRG